MSIAFNRFKYWFSVCIVLAEWYNSDNLFSVALRVYHSHVPLPISHNLCVTRPMSCKWKDLYAEADSVLTCLLYHLFLQFYRTYMSHDSINWAVHLLQFHESWILLLSQFQFCQFQVVKEKFLVVHISFWCYLFDQC